MDLVNEFPICLLHVLEADITENTGVVDEDIDAPKGIDCGLDDPFAILNGVVVGDCLAACGLDLIDDLVGSLSLWLVAALREVYRKACDRHSNHASMRQGAQRLENARETDKVCLNDHGRDKLTDELPPSPLKLPPRSFTTTFAPRLAKKRAYSRPRPPPAPVTTTVWPSYRNSCAALMMCVLDL